MNESYNTRLVPKNYQAYRKSLARPSTSNTNSVCLHVSGPKSKIFERSHSIFYSHRTSNRSSIASRSKQRLSKFFCWTCNSPENQRQQQDYSSLRPGRGAGKGRGCCCGGGGNSEIENLPDSTMQQDETTVHYNVEFSYPFLDQTSWSIGIVKKQYLYIRVVLRPPDIWIGHIKLKEPLEEAKFFADFENDYKKVVITIMKPTDTIWRTIGNPQEDHNTVMSSLEADPDFYPASIVLKQQLLDDHYLFAIHTNAEYLFGIPVAWHMVIKIGSEQKPYSPIKFITSKQVQEYSGLETDDIKGIGQITFFIIKIWPEGSLTSKLNELPLHEHGVLEIGGIVGQFDTTWLFETDRLIIIAGGSGVSPWISVMKYCADRMDDILVRQVIFIYSCNVSSVDKMIWHDVWESMATLDWFFYVPYMTTRSEDSETSTRFTPESIQADFEEIPEPKDASKPMIVKGMGCGPKGFVESCNEVFRSLDIGDENMMLFSG